MVDDEDFDRINQWKWTAYKGGKSLYALRKDFSSGVGVNVALGRFILNAPKGLRVDHRNGNGLDNQRHNIRLCTHAQNMANRRKTDGRTSNFKGVAFQTKERMFSAQIKVNYESIHLGLFESEIDAALAYNNAARKHFGEFARLNVFIEVEKETLPQPLAIGGQSVEDTAFAAQTSQLPNTTMQKENIETNQPPP